MVCIPDSTTNRFLVSHVVFSFIEVSSYHRTCMRQSSHRSFPAFFQEANPVPRLSFSSLQRPRTLSHGPLTSLLVSFTIFRIDTSFKLIPKVHPSALRSKTALEQLPSRLRSTSTPEVSTSAFVTLTANKPISCSDQQLYCGSFKLQLFYVGSFHSWCYYYSQRINPFHDCYVGSVR